ncbi:MAG: hypothetical protein GDA50_03625 [Alphaproteobacteria bacterium GM202ARS2]|nr:hypothetical protein [Alphaproteobacteria bacterium GM202ARS2]
MASNTNVLISYTGPDRAGLISSITAVLYDKGGSLHDITFAALGQGAELAFIYEMPDDLSVDQLSGLLTALEPVKQGEMSVAPFHLKTERGPSNRITHRFVLSGKDKRGFIRDMVKVLDECSAIIVRMNAERFHGSSGDLYFARFAVALRKERSADCLALVAKLASDYEMGLRYETA